jgi:hypothetical protein
MRLKDILLSEISYAQNNKYHTSYVEYKKIKFIEAENRMVVPTGWLLAGKYFEICWLKNIKISIEGRKSSGELLYNTVIIDNNNMLYT